MPDRYFLNATILFEPEKNRLSAINAGQAPIILNQPASRCLELLLEHYPEVVKQRDFFDFVWGEIGLNVPNNTLYQNISLLRKGLKAFGGEFDNAVITVPRTGFKLNPELRISHSESEQEGDNSLTDSQPGAEQGISSNETTRLQPEHSNEVLLPPTTSAKRIYRTVVLPVILLSMVIGCLIGFIAEEFIPSSPAFDVRYLTQRMKLEGCTLYELKETNFVPTPNDLVRWGIQCKNAPYLYLLQYKYSALTNILNCKSPLVHTTTPDCVNYIVVARNKP